MSDDFEVGEFDPDVSENNSKAVEKVKDKEGAKIRVPVGRFRVCDASKREYIPCMDNVEAIKKMESTERGERFERHCPEEGKVLDCLVPAPKDYKGPIPWPKSREEVCELETCRYRECVELIRNLQGRLELHYVSAQMGGDAHVGQYEDNEEFHSVSTNESNQKESDLVVQLGEKMQTKRSSSTESSSQDQVKQNRCATCNATVGDTREYREHFKTDWHKHNLRRKTKQLPPITSEECKYEVEMFHLNADLGDYSF